ESIDLLVRTLKKDKKIPAATLVTPAEKDDCRNPDVVKTVMDIRGRALYFSRAPIPFLKEKRSQLILCKHIGIYAFRFPALKAFVFLKPSPLEKTEKLEQLRLLENGIGIKLVKTKLRLQAVDTPEDIKKVEKILK
ncbi:MAG TPA: 3-deoxy-manno-octulosonate cytidylyltransferase, partial [bacterium]|nr:3-deoxy-manno-octulosonate cytidylyltransferase [bacterium]